MPSPAAPTRKQLLATLASLGYNGPVSYPNARLVAILADYAPAQRTDRQVLANRTNKQCKLTARHCDSCHATDPALVPPGAVHSVCCNELVIDPQVVTCRNAWA